MVARFSDGAGRRPAYMAYFIIYILANIGPTLQSNYVALMILRAVQSAGSSGTLALSNGCVDDIVTSSERGTYTDRPTAPVFLSAEPVPSHTIRVEKV